jgi:glycosyltransferase involved in cell wall biosynthesis
MPKTHYNIAYLTGEDPDDQRTWSGTLYNVAKTLANRQCHIHKFGPAKPWFHFLYAILNQLSLVIFKKRIDYRHSTIYAKAYAKLFDAKLKSGTFDLVIAVGGSEFVAYLKTDVPIVLIVDRTIAGAIDYHHILRGLWVWSRQQSIATDQKAMQKAKLNVYASSWALEAAASNYNLTESQILELPFGANFSKLPDFQSLKKRLLTKEICRLLFVGTDWINKGGTIAVDAVNTLNKMGIRATLSVVGCDVPIENQNEFVVPIGFLNKNNPIEEKQLYDLFLSSHFLIVPTRFEAYGLVFVEAAAFGLYAIATDTGGVKSAMGNGHTGTAMNFECVGVDYAEIIAERWRNQEAYAASIEKLRSYYEQNLTWDSWGNQLMARLKADSLIQ